MSHIEDSNSQQSTKQFNITVGNSDITNLANNTKTIIAHSFVEDTANRDKQSMHTGRVCTSKRTLTKDTTTNLHKRARKIK